MAKHAAMRALSRHIAQQQTARKIAAPEQPAAGHDPDLDATKADSMCMLSRHLTRQHAR